MDIEVGSKALLYRYADSKASLDMYNQEHNSKLFSSK